MTHRKPVLLICQVCGGTGGDRYHKCDVCEGRGTIASYIELSIADAFTPPDPFGHSVKA